MAIPVQRPTQPQQVYQGGRPGSNNGSKTGTAAGLAIGGVIGGIAGGGPGGAVQGASTGANLGSILGGFADKKPKDPSPVMVKPAPQPVAQNESAISRRLMANQQDSLSTYGEGLSALARQAPEVRQEYGPPLFQAYMQEYNKRQGVA